MAVFGIKWTTLQKWVRLWNEGGIEKLAVGKPAGRPSKMTTEARDVELLFKQLKSHFRIHDIPSRKRHVVEALVYAAILTLVLSRALLFAMRRRLKLPTKRTPEQRWTAVFQSVATSLLHLLITRPARGLATTWEMLEKFLAHEILDPNRHRTLRLNFGKA
jgi:transposase